MRITSMLELYERMPKDQRQICDVLRSTILQCLPEVKEMFSWNVPYFYKNKGICIVWPAAIPRGGITTGVLFGLWYGNQLKDQESFLTRGTNSQIFYRKYFDVNEIDEAPINRLLLQAWELDRRGAVSSVSRSRIPGCPKFRAG